MSENRMTKKHPHADSRLALFLDRQIMAIRPKKQNDIAIEAGFKHPNMITMLKLGTAKLPLDRVGALAKAIDCDPKYLFKLALEQQGHETTAQAINGKRPA